MEGIARVLVVTAHPDDAEFGAGGTIARFTRQGAEVACVVVTGGAMGSSDPAMTRERVARIREAEQRAAARVLGVRPVAFLGHEAFGERHGHADAEPFDRIVVSR